VTDPSAANGLRNSMIPGGCSSRNAPYGRNPCTIASAAA